MLNADLQYKRVILCAIFPLTLSACGGSGGDGGSAGISYTGETAQASLTINNGEEISTTAYQNGGSGQGLGTVLSSVNNPAPTAQKFRPATSSVAKSLVGAINKIELSPNTAIGNRAIETVSDSIDGDCGGSANFTISANDVTGDFNGNFNFVNYCNLGDYMNGGMNFAGNINVNTLDFTSMTMTITSLTVTTGNDSFTMSGNMSLDPSDNPIAVTMNMKLKDNSTEQVFWSENFSLSIWDAISYEELTMQGRFYHPDHGHVDITTPTAFRYTGSNIYPYPGVMVATGANNSTTTLTSLSTTSYQLDIDENGDGNPEQTTTGNWSEL